MNEHIDLLGKSAVVQKDARQLALLRITGGMDASEVQAGTADTLFLPLSPGDYADAVSRVAKDGLVVCYAPSAMIAEAVRSAGANIIDLSADEKFVMANANVTAECAIAMMILDSPFSIQDSDCHIYGGGRIALALATKLKALGAGRVCLYARNQEQREEAQKIGALSGELNDTTRLGAAAAVFNTVPHPIIGQEHLSRMPAGCLIYELASSDGFNKAAAESLGLRPIAALGLPGKYAPDSAAALILAATLRAIFWR